MVLYYLVLAYIVIKLKNVNFMLTVAGLTFKLLANFINFTISNLKNTVKLLLLINAIKSNNF